MNVSIPSELEQFIDAQVTSGRYRSTNELIQDALRLLQEREARRQALREEIGKKIDEGWEAAERGELFDGEAVFEELLRQSKNHRPASAP